MSDYYIPTPEQIAAECLLIQAEWTPAERLRRGTHREKPQEARQRAVPVSLPDGVTAHVDGGSVQVLAVSGEVAFDA